MLDAAGGFAFLIAGLLAGARRPENRVGLLMVLVSIGFFAEDLQLSLDSWTHSVGLLLVRARAAFLVHLVLAFPGGRLTTRGQRWIATLAYFGVFVLTPVQAFVRDSGWRRPPKTNRLQLVDLPAAEKLLGSLYNVIAVAVAVCVIVVLVQRWRRAGPPARRVLAPVFVAGLLGAGSALTSEWGGPFEWPPRVAFGLLPVAFLSPTASTPATPP